MKEKFELMREYCRNKKDKQYLYSSKFSKSGKNYNILFSNTSSTANASVFNEIIDLLVEDDNFMWFINELKKDAKTLYELNRKKGEERKNRSYKNWLKRQGCNKYCGTKVRKKLNDMNGTSVERIGEYRLYENYKTKEHPVLGKSSKYQVPLMREYNGKRAIDIVFNDENTVYICELKKSTSTEGIFRCMSEILTYYFLMQEHIREDDKERYFFKECFGDNYNPDMEYKLEPAVICPSSFITNIDIDKVLEKLRQVCNIDLKIVTIHDDCGTLDE